jgi:hypothetical protein
MLSLRPYTVLTRVLEGEMNGLARVSDDSVRRTMPYFEVVKRRDDHPDNQEARLVDAAERIANTWRLRGPAFVEIYDAMVVQSDWWERNHPILGFYEYLQHRNVEAVPTTALDRRGDYRAAFVRAVRTLGTGIGIRIYADELEMPDRTLADVVSLLSEAGVSASETDLVLNLERVRPDQLSKMRGLILDFFASAYQTVQPRSVTLIGSSVPEDLSAVTEDGEALVRRLELALWRDVGMGAWRRGLPLRLGDYGVVRPEYVDKRGPFPNINARLMYTVPEGILLLRGCSRKKVPLDEQYGRLASKLAGHRYFRDSMSWADRFVRASAHGAAASGQPSKWISVCTARHVEFACLQTEEILAAAN